MPAPGGEDARRANELTVAEAIRWAQEEMVRGLPARLGDARAEVARAEAEQLLLWAAGWERIDLVTRLRDRLPAAASARFRHAVARRKAGEPLQYITGRAPFLGRMFRVTPDVLIPRPETEVLYAAAAAWLRFPVCAHLRARIYDLGTGSGVLAISLALACPAAEVIACDISAAAVAVAAGNAAALGARVAWRTGDGFAVWGELASTGWLPHLVVSNPPYIPAGEIARLDAEVRDHEPRLALDGGPDGLDFYRRFAAMGDAAFAATPEPAAMLLEVGDGQADAVCALFAAQAERWPGWAFTVIPDLRGIPRVVAAARGAPLPALPQT